MPGVYNLCLLHKEINTMARDVFIRGLLPYDARLEGHVVQMPYDRSWLL